MLDSPHGQPLEHGGGDPLLLHGWPGEGTKLVVESRKYAPGLDALLLWAAGVGASRIDFSTGKPVMITVYGLNRNVTRESLQQPDITAVTNHLYGSDGSARLQDGKDFDVAYDISISRTERLRFRLNATPTQISRGAGVNIVLRPIVDSPASLDEQLVEPGIREACKPKNGMVLVGGSVGSGKSTLIAGITVSKLLDPNGHYRILEAAAPVEFLLEGIKSPCSRINQTEIPRDLDTFAAFIRGAWRREANEIIVGECRDAETMGAAVNAAMAGSTLTTTIHVNDVPLSMQRVVSLLPQNERANLITALGQSLRLIVNQRLAPSTDGKRVALREFLVFDAPLRRKLQQADPRDWPEVARAALDGQGQSYRTAIRLALEAGRITEATARTELMMEGG